MKMFLRQDVGCKGPVSVGCILKCQPSAPVGKDVTGNTEPDDLVASQY